MTLPDRTSVDGHAMHVERAWPRSRFDVSIELADGDGQRVAGQWFADDGLAEREVTRTPGARRCDDPGFVLQADGADRKLPHLAEAARRGDLLVHRPGKRAVLRTARGTYRKLTRPGRARALVDWHVALHDALDGVAEVPSVLTHGDAELELAAVPGVAPPEAQHHAEALWASWWRRVGTCLAALRTVTTPTLPAHTASDELAVVLRWLDLAMAYGLLEERDVTAELRPLLDQRPTALALAHRDLHDGQLLFDDMGVAVLDADTIARAEPALDLANLLVHLELRVEQNILDRRAAAIATDALLGDPALSSSTLARLRIYATTARLRLAGVYAFRPRWRPLARRWLLTETSLERTLRG